MRFRKLDMSLKDQRQALVDTFVNSIYLYDDKVLITFNYKVSTGACRCSGWVISSLRKRSSHRNPTF